MQTLSQLAFAITATASAIVLFAFLRRVMRAASAPAWLTHSFTAYSLGLFLTMIFGATLLSLANAVIALGQGVVVSVIISFVAHIVTWTIVRVIIPVNKGDGHVARLGLGRASPAINGHHAV